MQNLYENGGNLGKILQYVVKPPNLKCPILRVSSKNNIVLRDLAATNRTFSSFTKGSIHQI